MTTAHGPGGAASEFEVSTDAGEVADALRASVGVRHRLDATGQGEDQARLNDLGDLEGLVAVAKPGAAAALIKFLRRCLHVLMRPWLAMQTIYNRELARRFQDIAFTVRELDRRTPVLERSIQHLQARLDSAERRGLASTTTPSTRAHTSHDVERMFVHSRLPRPPARVLLVGETAIRLAADLTSFGFEVATVDVPPQGGGAFDVVVWMSSGADHQSAGTASVAALLAPAPRGQLLMSGRLRQAAAGASVEPDVAPLYVRERLIVIAEGALRVEADAPEARAAAARAGDAWWLIDARSDAPPR